MLRVGDDEPLQYLETVDSELSVVASDELDAAVEDELFVAVDFGMHAARGIFVLLEGFVVDFDFVFGRGDLETFNSAPVCLGVSFEELLLDISGLKVAVAVFD